MGFSLCDQLQVNNTFSMVGKPRSNALYAIERQNNYTAFTAANSHQLQLFLLLCLERSCTPSRAETIFDDLWIKFYIWQLEESDESGSLVEWVILTILRMLQWKTLLYLATSTLHFHTEKLSVLNQHIINTGIVRTGKNLFDGLSL